MTATEAADNTTTLKINAIYGTVTDMEDPSNWNHVLAFYGFASSATSLLRGDLLRDCSCSIVVRLKLSALNGLLTTTSLRLSRVSAVMSTAA